MLTTLVQSVSTAYSPKRSICCRAATCSTSTASTASRDTRCPTICVRVAVATTTKSYSRYLKSDKRSEVFLRHDIDASSIKLSNVSSMWLNNQVIHDSLFGCHYSSIHGVYWICLVEYRLVRLSALFHQFF